MNLARCVSISRPLRQEVVTSCPSRDAGRAPSDSQVFLPGRTLKDHPLRTMTASISKPIDVDRPASLACKTHEDQGVDPEAYFEDSLLSLFDHRPVAFSTSRPGEPYIYHPPADEGDVGGSGDGESAAPIIVHLPIAPSALHTTLQLTHIWLSSILIADLIFPGRIDVAGKRVAELGAGAGLPSVAALRCGAAEVVATDYDVKVDRGAQREAGELDLEDVIGVLRHNLATNQTDDGDASTWEVLGHTWAEDVTPLLTAPKSRVSSPTRFDVLLLADLLWSSMAHTALVTSVTRLLQPHTGVGHVVAGLHQGRGAVERFKRAWLDAGDGNWVEDVEEVWWAKQGGWEPYTRPSRELGSEEERGVVVWFKIGCGPKANR